MHGGDHGRGRRAAAPWNFLWVRLLHLHASPDLPCAPPSIAVPTQVPSKTHTKKKAGVGARPPPSRPGRSCSLGRPTSSSRRTSSAPSSPSSPSPPRSCSCSPLPPLPLPLPARARAAPRRPVGRSSSIAPCRTHCRSSSPTTSSSAAPPGRTGTGRGGSPRWCCTGTCASPSGQGVRGGARRVRQVPPLGAQAGDHRGGRRRRGRRRRAQPGAQEEPRAAVPRAPRQPAPPRRVRRRERRRVLRVAC